MRYTELVSQSNLELAWQRIATATNHQYKRFFRSSLLALDAARSVFIPRLQQRLKGSWTPTAPKRVYIPKPSGLQRPLSLLPIEDQVVLQAVANAFATKLLQRRAAVSRKVVFSNILNDQPRSIFFVRRWQETYQAFQEACETHFSAGYRWVAHFDLAAFYDTISHDLLLQRVAPRGGDDETWSRVKTWLRAWSAEASEKPFDHGIPQGPIAADFLAECLLLPMDEQLLREKVRYVRYVDDIRIFSKTRADAQKAVLLLERLCRNMGLIPQGGKFAIHEARSRSEVLGGLPSLAPPDYSGGEPQMEAAEAERLFEASMSGRPYRIADRSRARYVLYRAPQSARLLRWVLKLLPRHPEHVDAFVHFLGNYPTSSQIERVGRDLILAGTPYEYFRGELWHVLARVASESVMSSLVAVAKADLSSATSVAQAWGALHFLLVAQERGLCAAAHRVVHQDPMVQALLADSLPTSAYQREGAVRRLLLKGCPEAGACLASQLIARGLAHGDFGLRIADLHPVVQDVFRALGLVAGGRRSPVDQVGEILSRRYGVAVIPKWRLVLGNEYSHALQILCQAEFAFDPARSSWLQHQDSFNDVLTRAFIDFLADNGLPGGRATRDQLGARIKFGILLDPNQPFGQVHSSLAAVLKKAHDRRNRLPGSHPYDQKSGGRTRRLSRPERDSLSTDLSAAYSTIMTIVDQAT